LATPSAHAIRPRLVRADVEYHPASIAVLDAVDATIRDITERRES